MSTPEELSSQPALPQPLPQEPVRLEPAFPAWSWWDFLRLTVLAVVALICSLFIVGAIGGMVAYAVTGKIRPDQFAVLAIVAQGMAYALVLAYIARILQERSGASAMSALEWNWSPRLLGIGLLGGVVLALVTMLLQSRLPVPKDLPIEQLFKGPGTAYAFALFAVMLAPLFEEVYFRGLMFPLVRRGLGSLPAVLITSAAFALIHGTQLAFSWSALLSVFFVGLVLTVVRSRFHSVAASWTVHVAYNTTLMLTLWFSTDQFRHFDKLK